MANILNELAEVSKFLTEEARDQRLADIVEEAMEELAAGTPNGEKWIPVNERLPKQEQIPFDCLVALRSGAVREATFLDVDPVHRWCTELHYFNTGDVIAWMPLPEPPMLG